MFDVQSNRIQHHRRVHDSENSLITTRADRLAAELEDAIVAGDFEPGVRLDEISLAKRFGVSRTPVREALRQLTTTGLIDIRPRRGAIVTHIDRRRLEELFVAMGELEATCARLSAISMTPLERRRLEILHDEMGVVARRPNETEYAKANVTFHSTIYAGAHNTLLAETATGLRRRLAPFRRAQFRTPGRLAASYAEHGVVVDAILRGDATAAHAAMIRHVSLVEIAYDKLSDGKRPS